MERRKLKIIPFYTGIAYLEEILHAPEHHQLLFLEILLNNSIPWEELLEVEAIRDAYAEALGFYETYKTAIIGRGFSPHLLLDRVRKSPPSSQKLRLFWEALTFAEHQLTHPS